MAAARATPAWSRNRAAEKHDLARLVGQRSHPDRQRRFEFVPVRPDRFPGRGPIGRRDADVPYNALAIYQANDTMPWPPAAQVFHGSSR